MTYEIDCCHALTDILHQRATEFIESARPNPATSNGFDASVATGRLKHLLAFFGRKSSHMRPPPELRRRFRYHRSIVTEKKFEFS